jgi:hypothetical protein
LLIRADLGSDESQQIGLGVFHDEVEVFAYLVGLHVKEFYYIRVVVELVQDGNLPIASLSIDQIREGSIDLLDSDSLPVLLIHCSPYCSVVSATHLADEIKLATDSFVY